MSRARTFVAVELPPDVVERLVRLQEALRASGARVKWVARQNLHLTVKFLGDVEYERVNEISKVLAGAVSDTVPFSLTVRGAGTFPKGGRAPRVVWAALEGYIEPLEKIYSRLNEGLVKFGVPYEKRRFSPHITIGRVKGAAGSRELVETIQSHADSEFGEVTVSELVLMQSELTGKGPVYTALAHIPLKQD